MMKARNEIGLSMGAIADEARVVFDEMYTIHDILNGDNIKMHEEARKVAVYRLKYYEWVNDFMTWAGFLSYYGYTREEGAELIEVWKELGLMTKREKR